jgi:hypothetical protein
MSTASGDFQAPQTADTVSMIQRQQHPQAEVLTDQTSAACVQLAAWRLISAAAVVQQQLVGVAAVLWPACLCSSTFGALVVIEIVQFSAITSCGAVLQAASCMMCCCGRT